MQTFKQPPPKIMNQNYNINEAISLRGLTFDQAGLFDIQMMPPDTKYAIIDFRISIEIAELNPFDLPIHIDALIGSLGGKVLDRLHTITRSEWKKAYANYRCYLSQGYSNNNHYSL